MGFIKFRWFGGEEREKGRLKSVSLTKLIATTKLEV
jgi:hypothetical protein